MVDCRNADCAVEFTIAKRQLARVAHSCIGPGVDARDARVLHESFGCVGINPEIAAVDIHGRDGHSRPGSSTRQLARPESRTDIDDAAGSAGKKVSVDGGTGRFRREHSVNDDQRRDAPKSRQGCRR